MTAKTTGATAIHKEVPAEESSRRHPLLLIVGIAGFLMFAYGGFLAQKMLDPSAFPIRKIALEGEFRRLAPEQVEAMVSKAVDGGFFSVDVEAVRARILDEPWVYEASVQRVWPDTIRVAIREQTAVARWGKYALLNEFADIFAPQAEALPADLVLLDGPLGSEAEVLGRYSSIQKKLAESNLEVAELVLSPRRAWRIGLVDGASLVIGRGDIEHRLQRFNRVFQRVLKNHWAGIASVDLRYTNGFAIQQKRSVIGKG